MSELKGKCLVNGSGDSENPGDGLQANETGGTLAVRVGHGQKIRTTQVGQKPEAAPWRGFKEKTACMLPDGQKANLSAPKKPPQLCCFITSHYV